MSASMDGSESVDQFLARIASLSRKDDEQEAERNRRMEEEMMQARKERRARREERARSISPVKTGPAAAMSSPRTRASPPQRSIDPPVTFTPRSQTHTPTRREGSQSPLVPKSPGASPFETSRPLPPPPLETPSTPSFPPSNSSSLSRTGTLSWQQRPTSRDGPSVRSRPLSTARLPFREPADKQPEPAAEEGNPDPSRADIAASLGARDPSWFRQTADRGLGSAAYRKSNEEPSASDLRSARGMRLPGMNPPATKPSSDLTDSTREPVGRRTPPASESNGKAKDGLPHASLSSNTFPSKLSLGPHAPSPDLRPSQEDTGSLTRSSVGRPPSPTKGLGGFVQSAMMRRSDSVSKRWSVQANTGLKRGDSVAGTRPAFNPTPASPSLGQPRTLLRDPKPLRDGTSSPLSSSRPTSSSGPERPLSTHEKAVGDVDIPGKKQSSYESTDIAERQPPTTPPPSDSLLSRSPSKTLDPRRWSPTKASWLESALSKPDSPRPVAPKPELPAWKVGLERSKSQKNLDRSPSRPSPFDPVSTGGLLRSPTPASPTKTQAALAETMSTPISTRQLTVEHGKDDRKKHAVSQVSSEATDTTRSDAQNEPEATSLKNSAPQKRFQDLRETAAPVPMTPQLMPEEEPVRGSKPNFNKSIDKQPPAPKPKPQTPPKTDFRSTLRSRQADTSGSGEKEPEFKAVFGNLKRAQTQNYVAPDVLKDNITRGKADLNVTVGPQKTKRVDEFKESILQRKEDMKIGGGSIHKRAESHVARAAAPEPKEDDIPEALARRKTLHRTKASVDAAPGKSELPPLKPTMPKPLSATAIKSAAVGTKPPLSKPASKQESSTSVDLGKAEPKSSRTTEPVQPTPVSNTTLTSSKSSSQTPAATPPVLPSSEPISRTASVSSDKELSKTASNKLAARLNPALVGLIARGNSPRPINENGSSKASIDLDPRQPASSTSRGRDEPTGLTHMTKGRAKGPKRRAPVAEPVPIASVPTPASVAPEETLLVPKPASVEEEKNSPSAIGKAAGAENVMVKAKPVTTTKPSITQKPAVSLPRAALDTDTSPAMNIDGISDTIKDKPRVASKSPELRRVSEKQKVALEQAEVSPSRAAQAKPFNIVEDKSTQEPHPVKSRQIESPVRSTRTNPLTISKTKVNTPKMSNPTHDCPVLKATPKTGLGLNFTPDTKQKVQTPELTPPPEKDIRVNGSRVGDEDAKTVLLDFFGVVPKSTDRFDFDSEAFLKVQSENIARVKKLSNKIVELSGDGKQSALPPSQEHILYEDSMYLCVHTFNLNDSKTTEVYLWAGDAVAEAAIEDAQIFCKKVARENSTKLEVIKQGKESPRFFSALGGILIIRKSKSSALYMLCGRRHGGHVVFDEVDFSSASLCSGFSFLLSAKFGKLYLWIGAGSCADEYGAARLIGNDLGLTGEIEEVSEGKEPASFWEAFSTLSAKKQARSSDTWSIRAGNDHNGFPCRLYRIEQERPKSSGGFWGLRASSPPKSSNKASLQEISPYSQRDLDGSYVHLLDAYATLYVVPGRPSSAKSTDFVSALHIAQELAVLTPSMQDRALLPSCQIIFGEPPQDFRAAFRKWTPGLNVETGAKSACIDVVDAMMVLG